MCDKVVCERWCGGGGGGMRATGQRRWMSPNATPTTQNEGGCHHMQLLPRLPKIDVTKCHACETKVDALPVLQPRTLIDKVVKKLCVAKLCDKCGCKMVW